MFSISSTDFGIGLPWRLSAAIRPVICFIHSYFAMQSSTWISAHGRVGQQCIAKNALTTHSRYLRTCVIVQPTSLATRWRLAAPNFDKSAFSSASMALHCTCLGGMPAEVVKGVSKWHFRAEHLSSPNDLLISPQISLCKGVANTASAADKACQAAHLPGPLEGGCVCCRAPCSAQKGSAWHFSAGQTAD